MIYLDFPDAEAEMWNPVAQFKTKAEALAWVREKFGFNSITPDGWMQVITGEEEEDVRTENSN